MKVILRTLIVLLVTAAFTGGVYLFFTYSGVSVAPVGGLDRGAPPALDGSRLPAGSDTSSTSAQTRPQRGADGTGPTKPMGGGGEMHAEGGTNLAAALPGLGRNLGILALITLAIVLVQKAVTWLKRRKPAAA